MYNELNACAMVLEIPQIYSHGRKYTIYWRTIEPTPVRVGLNFHLGLMDSHVCPENTANQHMGMLFPGQSVNW